ERVVAGCEVVLLLTHLYFVGRRWEESEPAQQYRCEGNPNRGAVGADAIVHYRRLLALDAGEEPAEVEDEHHDEGHASEDDPEVQNHRLVSPAAAARTATTALMRGQARGVPAARARWWAARRRASRRRRRWTGT